eukprot:Gb_24708 [translate_table: standard]
MGAKLSLEQNITKSPPKEDKNLCAALPQEMPEVNKHSEPGRELSVSFGYQCNEKPMCIQRPSHEVEVSAEIKFSNPKFTHRSSSFSCLSGAALSANATLANTTICNGLIGEEILPGLDSPKSFRRLASSPSLSRLEFSSSSQSSISTLSGSLSTQHEILESEKSFLGSTSAPTRIETSSFLNATDVQMAGGAAGEDRVQAVCSEENGWLFCGVYDGFNGRDAADFLAGTLYENIGFYLHLLEWRMKQQADLTANPSSVRGLPEQLPEGNDVQHHMSPSINYLNQCDIMESTNKDTELLQSEDEKVSSNSFRQGVTNCLQLALSQAESDFMYMVEQEMDDRPDLVTIGSCVLVVLLHGQDLYTLSLGDSRAVLAMSDYSTDGKDDVCLKAIQLTETHTVDEETERTQLLAEHPDDPLTVFGGRVKGKLKLTRAFGVGYLKKSKMNNVLMGILRVRNLSSPPYIRTEPSVNIHRVSEHDRFVVIGSDGLFDFFSNDEVVTLVDLYISDNPSGDPAKYILEQLVLRAAENAGMSMEQLMSIPVGRRRKYHDDVTVIIILLGKKQRTTTASTSL